MTAAELDLFGNPLERPEAAPPSRRVTNDMDLVEKVLATAVSDGYVLVGAGEKVFRLVGSKVTTAVGSYEEITPVAGYEADVVHQLLNRKWLTKGGTHSYGCGGHSGPGNSVLVPRTTRHKVRLWRNLTPLTSRKGHLRAVPNDQ